jgi:hypothetical protein
MAVTMKNAVFLDVAPCRSHGLNRRFGGTQVSRFTAELTCKVKKKFVN